MKISFKQMLQPMNEAIYVDGAPYLLSKRYDNIVKEDANLVLTFQSDGIVHLELKECRGLSERESYVRCNNFINTFFPRAISFTTRNESDRSVIFGYVECACHVQRDGKTYKRTVNIENAITNYKDGRCEHDGINFYLCEEEITPGKKNKKKKKK